MDGHLLPGLSDGAKKVVEAIDGKSMIGRFVLSSNRSSTWGSSRATCGHQRWRLTDLRLAQA
jgi:hypothetical protein